MISLESTAKQIEDAAKQWDDFASSKEAWADYLENRGECADPHRSLARTCRAAAASLRLTLSTGKPHCVCHLKVCA
jgi:hypothetical protein